MPETDAASFFNDTTPLTSANTFPYHSSFTSRYIDSSSMNVTVQSCRNRPRSCRFHVASVLQSTGTNFVCSVPVDRGLALSRSQSPRPDNHRTRITTLHTRKRDNRMRRHQQHRSSADGTRFHTSSGTD
jgi:hypothetical protein